MKTIHFFLDFDGTISTTDVVDLVLENFADESWKRVEAEWAAGKIGSRECLSRQAALIQTDEAALRNLVSKVQVDPYFVPFLKKAEELGVLVTIVSDGFDVLIEEVLKNNLENKTTHVKALPIFSNILQKTATGFKAEFADPAVCVHGCANCKPLVMKKMSSTGDAVFFVGDGLSDRFAAEKAHVVFAKGKLQQYCEDKKIHHIPYKDFNKITEWLVENHAMLMKANFGVR